MENSEQQMSKPLPEAEFNAFLDAQYPERKNPCECSHSIASHKGGQCGQCGCTRFITQKMRETLDDLRVKVEASYAFLAQPKIMMPKPASYWPSPADVDNPRLCVTCQHVILADTETWPEPLCHEHYYEQCNLPPRAVLTFADGHQEMRRNVIYTQVYRDVEQDDRPDGDVTVRWFERVSEQREQGRLVMQFYREIEAPVDALGRPKGQQQDERAKIASLLDEYRAEKAFNRKLRWYMLAVSPFGIAFGWWLGNVVRAALR